MPNETDARARRQRFTVEWEGPLAILRFGQPPIFFSSDLSARDELMAVLERCRRDPTVRAVLLLGFPEKAGSAEYESFLRQHAQSGDTVTVNRMLNIFNQLIVALVTCPKFVIFVDSGVVISQFLNVGLACDYRLVGEDTVVQKAYLHHGVIPKGGGVLFLSELLGRSRTLQLLLAEEDLTAQQLLDLGIVDEIAPVDQLEERARRLGQRLASRPTTTTAGLKRLLNYSLRQLEDYLAFENEQFLLSLRQGGGSKGGG